MRLASFWQRLVAAVFELQIQWLVVLAYFANGVVKLQSLSDLVSLVLSSFVIVIWLGLIFVLYSSVFTSRFGAGLGKMILGLRVQDHDGKLFSLGKSFFRQTVGYAISNLVLGLGFLWIFKDKNRQAWHDKIIGGFVTSSQTSSVSRFLVGLVIVMMLFLGNLYLVMTSIGSLLGNQSLGKDLEKFSKTLERVIYSPEKSFPEGPEEAVTT